MGAEQRRREEQQEEEEEPGGAEGEQDQGEEEEDGGEAGGQSRGGPAAGGGGGSLPGEPPSASPPRGHPPSPSPLHFGLVPWELHARLLDQQDYRGRVGAMEQLKRVLAEAPGPALASLPVPSLLGLLALLRALLDDSNFKVALGALEGLRILAAQLGRHACATPPPWLEPLVSAAAKVLGDAKLAIRQEYHQLFLGLMRAAGPRPVLNLLLRSEHLRHRNSRVREVVVAIAVAALLTFPSEDFDLPGMVDTLAPALADPKRRVRHAALEAFAVLAYALGPGRTSIIFQAVDAVELQDDGEGVMAAVQARLARKTLPRLTEQWFVEYAVPLPPSSSSSSSSAGAAHGRGFHLPHGADTDWLLEGNRIQSAHSCSGEPSASLAPFGDHQAGIGPRRVLSAGKGKLPWESEPLSTSNNFLHSPKVRPSQGVMSSHQHHISGKCGPLGFAHTRGKSGSVDSDLQFVGLSNSWQDKVCTSLNFTNKPQRIFCSPPEHTPPPPLLGSHTNQGAFILPSYPFASPRHSPKHTSPPADPLRSSQDHTINFSNSWPLKSFEGLPKPTHQKKFSSSVGGEVAELKFQGTPPIQLKPAFVRPPSSRRGLSGTKPVPPIPRGVSPLPDKEKTSILGHKNGEAEDLWLNERNKKLSLDLSELNVSEKDLDEDEMQSSLRSLRNSAAKKRAKLNGSMSDLESPDSVLKLDLTSDSPSCLSSPSTSSYSESGIYSQDSITSPLSSGPQGIRTMSDTLPVLGGSSRPMKLSPARSQGPVILEQSPSTVILFHEKAASGVSISGQRLNFGNGSGDYEEVRQKAVSPVVLKGQGREHQRHSKSTKGFAGPTQSLQQLTSLDFISPSALPEDSVVVVGKGVFGSSPPAPLTYSQSIMFSMENGDASSFKPSMEPLSGIYGRAVQQQSSALYLDVENERDVKVALSKSAREKMRQKKREEKEHRDVRDLEKKDPNPWDHLKPSEPERMATESRNAAFSPMLKRTPSIKRTQPSVLLDSGEISPGPRIQVKDRILPAMHSPEIMEPSELRPFPKPELALLEALRHLSEEDWERKIEGLNSIRCLSAYHPDTLTAKLHETSLAVVQELKNPRSVVSRAAVVCLGDLFYYLKKRMDQELDNTVKALLHKAGESNTFIRENVDKALKAMVSNVTPARALSSLISGGQSHLNTTVRRCTAQHLSDIVEHMGPGRILSGIKDVTDKILSAVAKFVQDGSQETRYYGRKMLFTLMTHADFDKMLEKNVLPKDLPYVKETVNNLRQKGLGEMPIVTPSAKGRRSHNGNMDSSRSTSVSREVLHAGDREIREGHEISRKPAPRNALESAEYVKVLTTLLNAKDFRDRINGIKQLLADTESNQDLVVANIVKIFDAFKSRLHDSNSKVNQVALETMHRLVPLLKEKLSPVINMLIPALVDNNLNSKNPGIYAAATSVIQALCQHLDNYLLLQPFCTKAQFLNGKAKQDITEKLAELVVELYPRKPHAVEQKVLVVLWHLLGNLTNGGSLPSAGGNIRTATAKLSKALFAQMGQNLLTQAASQPPYIRRTLEEFLEQPT
ncbi:TOG array regulator of axonemal microtubules protein 1 isoform X2 [Sceloporus undulatus]|uniref:TOG array regulator of axonemal microtubules protein 1 isoform X2 n=1 Tax=Sceloporus undulatus TaxID=8520 RepID=UPI001C4BCB76|nr:TOG array regulator of axonemal microtubules protein 1 isoform X2 [Sceloporus undulatus]